MAKKHFAKGETVDLSGATGFYLYRPAIASSDQIMWVQLRDGHAVWLNASTGRFSAYSMLTMREIEERVRYGSMFRATASLKFMEEFIDEGL